jgi:hypothetical protein
MENAKKFFEEVVKTEEAKVLLAAVEAPKTEEDRIAAYIEIAKKLGLELTAEEIQEYFETASKADDAELDDDELEQLVGGGENADCESSYQHKENCWFNDGCDKVWRDYEGYQCSGKNLGYEASIHDEIKRKIELQYHLSCQSPSVNKKLKEKGFV